MATTTEVHESLKQTYAYSGKAIIALALGVTTLFLPSPFNIILAVMGITVALLSRRQLQADSQLRGTFASLVGFLLSAGVFVAVSFPFVFSVIVGLIVR